MSSNKRKETGSEDWNDAILSENEQNAFSSLQNDEQQSVGNPDTNSKRCMSFSSINKDEKKSPKEKKNIIKQIFNHKSKDRDKVSKGLWSVMNVVDVKVEDEISKETESSTYHNSESKSKQNISKKKEVSDRIIPIILINGVEMSDSDDEEDTDKRSIDDLFDTLDSNCTVYGEGIFGGYEHEPTVFFAQTKKDFDKSKFQVSIKGPKQRPIRTESVLIENNQCQFTYWPRRSGYYTLYVTWGGKHVVGSPFTVTIN